MTEPTPTDTTSQIIDFIPWSATKVNNANATDVSNYINERLAEYENENLYGSELHEYLSVDFHEFTPTTFKKTTETTKTLRDFLRKRNVFIPKSRNTQIAPALVDATHNSFCPMPYDMMNEVIESYRPITNFMTSRNPKSLPTPPENHNNPTITLMKAYAEDHKYAGTPSESFELKFTIFKDYCNTIGIPSDQQNVVFKIMLKDVALQFYHTNCLTDTSQSISSLYQAIKSQFEGKEYQQSMLVKWNETSLTSTLKETNSTDLEVSLNTLITNLRHMQISLSSEFHSDKILFAKLLQACRNHPACSIACSTIMDENSTSLINRLRSNVATWKAQQSSTTEQFPLYNHKDAEIFLTDRRYHSYNDNKPRLMKNNHRQGHHINNQKHKVCFVCRKVGCWSTRHSESERIQAQKHLKDVFNRNDNRHFLTDTISDNHSIDAFIQDYEGTDPDDDQSLADAYDVFLSLNNNNNNNNEHQNNNDIIFNQYFTTECGLLRSTHAKNLIQEINSNITRHALTGKSENLNIDNNTMTISQPSFDSNTFLGILIDTGAAGKSTAGHKQYQAFTKTFGETKINPCDTIQIRFGIGTTKSLGSITISTPIGICTFHVVKCNTPFLLSLQDLDNKNIIFNNLDNSLLCQSRSIPVTRISGHAFLQWGPSAATANITYLTEIELKTLHRRLGHPSSQRLANILLRSGHADDEGKHRRIIERIIKNCQKCQQYGDAPLRFKFTLRDSDIDFNHSIYADVMYIDDQPLLHVVDEATRFQSARWLPNLSPSTVWDALRTCWIDTYLGPPDIINHDAGTNFTSSEFQQYSLSLGIQTKQIPVESANSMGIVERYHKPLRRAYAVIKDETNSTNKNLLLQMAVKAINDTAGPDGIVPTLLVFGAYPRMTKLDLPAPNIATRAKAIQKAMAEVSKLRLQKQITAALHTRNGPSTNAHNIPIGTDILVWRTHKNRWEGPFKLLSLERENATIQLPNGPTIFRSTSIKPFTADQNNVHSENTHNNNTESSRTAQPDARPQRSRRLPARFRNIETDTNITYIIEADLNRSPNTTSHILINENLNQNFALSRQKELEGLLLRGVFEYTNVNTIPPNSRIFKSRFVDTVKSPGTPQAFEKSRLVVQGYNDTDKNNILTQSPTVQRSSQRILVSIAVIRGLNMYTRDITQAYIQSTTSLTRSIYIWPPKEMNQPPHILLRLLKPLYGIAEAGTHWFRTYHAHHTKNLSLIQAASDPCLLYNKNAVVALQTDDTLFACNEIHKQKEQTELEHAKLTAKQLIQLTADKPITFNGATYTLKADYISVTQTTHCQNLSLVPNNDPNAYTIERARAAYISSVCQPQATFDLSRAAQFTKPSQAQIDSLNKRLRWQMKGAGIRFVKLNEAELRITAFTDSSFANNADYSSQIGFIIVLADSRNCNIIHWSSTKCKRVTRSVLASELYAMVAGFDAACVIKHTIDAILNRKIPLVICIDSRSLYECLVKLGITKEKRLMIDIAAIRQAYERREISQIIWIKGNSNPADAMTKSQFENQALEQLIANNYWIDKEAWVDREIKSEVTNNMDKLSNIEDMTETIEEGKTASVGSCSSTS